MGDCVCERETGTETGTEDANAARGERGRQTSGNSAQARDHGEEQGNSRRGREAAADAEGERTAGRAEEVRA